MVQKKTITFQTLKCKTLFVLCFTFTFGALNAQTTITGKVLNAQTHHSVPGATIVLNDSSRYTITDESGKFTIKTHQPQAHIKVSHLGYKSTGKIISSSAEQSTIYLHPSNQQINELIVRSDKPFLTKDYANKSFTASTITPEGLDLHGKSVNSSVYSKLALLSGINVSSEDPHGLSNKSVRIRGVKSFFSGMTMEGIPNYGIMPIGPRETMYDMENINSVTFHKGAIPVDVIAGTGNKGGVMALSLKQPRDSFRITGSLSGGNFSYRRSFVRLDAGKLPFGTKVFGSYSYTQANKWKGKGKLGPRHHAALGINHSINDQTSIEIFGTYNTGDRHFFRELAYEQAKDPEQNYDLHFNDHFTDTAARDVNYYDYNQGSFTNPLVFGIFRHHFTGGGDLSIKPYYSDETADIWEKKISGPPNNRNYMLFHRHREVERYGIIPEMNLHISSLRITGGYWFELNDLQASVHVYKLLTGEERKDLGADPITENTSLGSIHNPYLHVSGTFNKWSWQAGVQYFYHADANTKNYRTSGDSLVHAPNLDMTGISHSALLPSAGVNYNVTTNLQIRAAYSKNYMRSYMYGPIKSLYTRNQDAFEKAGMTLEDIFDQWELETSDQLDLGIRYANGNYTLEMTPFYAFHHHVLTPVYDPDVDLQYYQNVGEVRARGIEWNSFFRFFQSLSLYFNTTYSQMSYQENFKVKPKQTTPTRDIKNNQIPALPKLSIKSGITYDFRNFTITSKIKYTGKRYGDATNEQEIDAHTLIDMQLSYKPQISWFENFRTMIELKNLLNTKYISRIQSMDYSKSGDASYFAGSTRAGIVTVKAGF